MRILINTIVFAVLTVFFTGCFGNKQVSVPQTGKENVKSVNKDDKLYDEVMDLRYSLFKSNGLDYVPWRTHMEDDKALMTYLKNNLNGKELSSLTTGYKLTSTRGKTFKASKDSYIFINYETDIRSLKSYLRSNTKRPAAKTPVVTKKSFEDLAGGNKTLVTSNVKSEPSRVIDFRARGVAGEAELEKLLYSISYSECRKIYEYVVFPMRNFKIFVDNKYKRMEIDVRASKSQLITACNQ